MIRCAVIDDEPLARKGIVGSIQEVPFLELIGAFADPSEAIPVLTSGRVDLLFLDMRMPRMNGLDLLRSLPHKPATVVISAHTEHALESYELEVLDYILKPFPPERFLKAVNKAREYLELKAQARDGFLRNEDHFFVKSEGSYMKIRFDEVLFVQAMQNYVIIRTVERQHVCYLTISAMEGQLPADRFLKVHKSYIVPLAKVDAIEADGLRVAGTLIPISRSGREGIVARIMGDRLLRR
jgi:DNA-binding LytR/AlgR family response regulator